MVFFDPKRILDAVEAGKPGIFFLAFKVVCARIDRVIEVGEKLRDRLDAFVAHARRPEEGFGLRDVPSLDRGDEFLCVVDKLLGLLRYVDLIGGKRLDELRVSPLGPRSRPLARTRARLQPRTVASWSSVSTLERFGTCWRSRRRGLGQLPAQIVASIPRPWKNEEITATDWLDVFL